MKKLVLIIAFIFPIITYCQKTDNKIYDDAIVMIKKSPKFHAFLIDNKSSNDNFKVSEKLYSICELYMFFRDKTNSRIKTNCENKDWINDPVAENCDLKKKSDKGQKSFNVRFTNTMEDFFFAEIKPRNKSNNSLLYIFKINGNAVDLIDINSIFYD